MSFKFLSLAQVKKIHDYSIEAFGGIHGIRDERMLEAAVMRPQTGYYNTLNEHAAALMESLSQNHPFLDGNKRIAFFATDAFLRVNGYQIICENEQTYVYFMQLFEQNNFKFDTLLKWLNTHVKQIS